MNPITTTIVRILTNTTVPSRETVFTFPFDRWPADEQISYSAYRRGGVTVQWTETYAESAGSFLTDLAIPLSHRHPLRTIRFVFWFD